MELWRSRFESREIRHPLLISHTDIAAEFSLPRGTTVSISAISFDARRAMLGRI
jgi:hypothetical protein